MALSGRRDGLLLRCRLSKTCPLVMQSDSEHEWWASRASLLVTDLAGNHLDLPADVRAYMIAGSPHNANPGEAMRRDPMMALAVNPMHAGPPMRAKPGGPGSAAQSLAKAKMVQTSTVSTLASAGATITQTAPQPLAPPEGFKPSVHTSPMEPPSAATQPTQAATEPGHRSAATQTGQRAHPAAPHEKPAFQLHPAAKIAVMASAAVLLVIAGVLILKWSRIKHDQQLLADLVALAERPDTRAVPVNATTLGMLLEAILKESTDAGLQSIGKSLILAEASDGTDVDAQIAEFATKRADVPASAADELIGTVLQTRNRPVILPTMLAFATSSKDPVLVVSALQALRQMAGDGQFGDFLKLIETTDNKNIRDAAELNLEAILRKTRNGPALAQQLTNARESNIKPEIQKALQRLQHVSETAKPPGK